MIIFVKTSSSVLNSNILGSFSLEFTFQSLFDQGYDILIPMLIGSLIVSIPVWFISYFTVKFLMFSFKKRKA